MKDNKLYALFGLALVASLSACSDDEIVKGNPADEGQEVNFGAQLDKTMSRTYYGDKDVANNAFPIYWNTEAKGYDKIFISAPQALAGRNQAYYTVKPTSDNQTTPAAVVKIGDTGIQWGAEATKFYGFYPGNENFKLSAAGNTVTANLPGDQTITFDYKLDAVTTSGYQYETNPDMSCVMMVAQTPTAINPTTDAVGLEFEPLSTVIDVTVLGPVESNVTNPYRVTSISLISETEQLCGEFTYDYDTKEITPKSTNAADRLITVRTMGLDSDGNYVGVPLHTGQTLNVKISMLPNVKVEDLKVQVTTADSKVWTKTLKTTNLAAGQINPVQLPQLEASRAQLDYSRWISQLDPRIYVSEVSLPGSALAFNIDGYMASGNEASTTQFGSLDQQFAAGIRAFQGHFWLVDNELMLTTSYGNSTGITLRHACNRLKEEMENSHSHGFCVLLLSDYKTSGSNIPMNEVFDSFKDLTSELQAENILAPNITPTTTLAEVRGKIILKLQLSGDKVPFDNYGNYYVSTNNALNSIQSTWSPLAISAGQQTKALFNIYTPVAATQIFYSPMTFGTIGTYTFTEASGYLSSNYKQAVITELTPGIAVEGAKLWAASAKYNYVGDMNATSRPADMSKGMWYIYAEESKAGAALDAAKKNIANMVSTIASTYTGQYYNKFYMTYVGGVGSNYGETVKNELNSAWLSETKSASEPDAHYPLGWVLFNDVTDHFTTAGGTPTITCIERVINQNTKEGFILERNRNAEITPAAVPNGDVKGVSKGVSIF